jgi:hypothetical protein
MIPNTAAGAAAANDDRTDVAALFHRLNNQLGIVLAQAELLEAKAIDDRNRARAAHVIAGVLEALGTARELRTQLQPERAFTRRSA